MVEIFPFVLEKEIEARWKKTRTCFKRGGYTEECDIWRGKQKSPKYPYFDQLLFLLPHLEDRETQSNLSTQRNRMRRKRTIRKEKERNSFEMFE